MNRDANDFGIRVLVNIASGGSNIGNNNVSSFRSVSKDSIVDAMKSENPEVSLEKLGVSQSMQKIFLEREAEPQSQSMLNPDTVTLMLPFFIAPYNDKLVLCWGSMRLNVKVASTADTLLSALGYDDYHCQRTYWSPQFQNVESDGSGNKDGNWERACTMVASVYGVDVVVFVIEEPTRIVKKFTKSETPICLKQHDVMSLDSSETFLLYDSRKRMFHGLNSPEKL